MLRLSLEDQSLMGVSGFSRRFSSRRVMAQIGVTFTAEPLSGLGMWVKRDVVSRRESILIFTV